MKTDTPQERQATSRNPLVSFSDLVRERRSIRGFLSEPVPSEIITEVLADAINSPSNCNMQPWKVHLVRGERLKELAQELSSDYAKSSQSPDFPFDPLQYPEVYRERRHEHGALVYDAQGVERGDAAGRYEALERNLHFFGAPHAFFLFIPKIGDPVRLASDMGMFAQTLLLSLSARGLGAIPQTMLGMYAGTIKRVLGISDQELMLFGVSFGFIDHDDAANTARMPRIDVSDVLTDHS